MLLTGVRVGGMVWRRTERVVDGGGGGGRGQLVVARELGRGSFGGPVAQDAVDRRDGRRGPVRAHACVTTSCSFGPVGVRQARCRRWQCAKGKQRLAVVFEHVITVVVRRYCFFTAMCHKVVETCCFVSAMCDCEANKGQQGATRPNNGASSSGGRWRPWRRAQRLIRRLVNHGRG